VSLEDHESVRNAVKNAERELVARSRTDNVEAVKAMMARCSRSRRLAARRTTQPADSGDRETAHFVTAIRNFAAIGRGKNAPGRSRSGPIRTDTDGHRIELTNEDDCKATRLIKKSDRLRRVRSPISTTIRACKST
jgi:hypothetical protein